jgi:hypothetical protein
MAKRIHELEFGEETKHRIFGERGFLPENDLLLKKEAKPSHGYGTLFSGL